LSEQLRRYAYPLLYLLLASVCAIGVAAQHGPSEIGFAPRMVLNLTLPLERMVTLPVQELRGVWSDYVALVGVREENDKLRGRLARLEDENQQYREAILSSERFQRLAGFRSQREIPMVPANVIHQDLSPWFQSLIIDQGAAAGIRPGMPVITDSGVVGLVAGTTPGAAKVMLMIDPQSRLDVYVERTRARGTVRGAASSTCDLDYVLRQESIEEGDLLLTSGMGGVYPKGLRVGRIAKVDHKTSGLFLAAQVEPAVDFARLDEVFVILEQRQVPEDDAFSSLDEGLWPDPPPPAKPEAVAEAAPRAAPEAPAPRPGRPAPARAAEPAPAPRAPEPAPQPEPEQVPPWAAEPAPPSDPAPADPAPAEAVPAAPATGTTP